MLQRSYYSEKFESFLNESNEQILGKIFQNDLHSEILETQKNSWKRQIEILKQLLDLKIDRILFEYSIPRMGKRVDNVLFYKNIVFILEFKVGERNYNKTDLMQVESYAFDLKNFQEGSRECKIVPVLVSTRAPPVENNLELLENNVYRPIMANETNLKDVIDEASKIFNEKQLDPIKWENSPYNPTPTIIEASIALYENHSVEDITRKDSVGEDFVKTISSIVNIIENSKKNSRKSIIFLTGIPGSGKTLVGLDIASKYQDIANHEYAVYISGTYTLVEIIQEALTRNRVEKSKFSPTKVTKQKTKELVNNLFQFLPKYREEILKGDKKPREKIVVFDEAQRMWNVDKFDKTVETKLKLEPTGKSETDLLLEYMDNHQDWAIILCLIGGGQEIHEGEDGTIEWIKSIQNKFNHWDVYMSPEFLTKEYLGDQLQITSFGTVQKNLINDLHLKKSTRSFRSENFSKFINNLLDKDLIHAKEIMNELNSKSDKFHLFMTRDLQIAKNWVRQKSHGNDRYGMLVSSKSLRLAPVGIIKRNQRDFNSIGWWLDSEDYIDSSFKLEIPCAEFFAQGLELDWSIFAWDACLRPTDTDWEYLTFTRRKWESINDPEKRRYLKNSFRVLLTRARQGMIIFIPKGDPLDNTFLPEYYDGIYDYLKQVGIKELSVL